jgi:hypothetical protein
LLGERLVEAKFVADDHERRAHSGPEVADGFAEERIQLVFVDGHG